MSISEEQLNSILRENEYLQVQVNDLNLILAEREQELELLRAAAADATELKSRLDSQLNEFQVLQNHIGHKERQVLGAEERELELQEELTTAIRLQHRYDELLTDYAYIQAQLTDLQLRHEELEARNLDLQRIAARAAEQESQLANTVMERDGLKQLLVSYKNKELKDSLSSD